MRDLNYRGVQKILTKKEKLLGFLIAIYSAGVFMALWLPHIHDKLAKGTNPLDIALEGVGIALLFAITVAVGKRIYVGFGGLAVALGPWGNKYVILGLPAIIFAAFAGFRYIWQPKGAKGSKAPTTRAAKAPSQKGSSRGASVPGSSRRYTQPKVRKGKTSAGATGNVYGSLGRLGPKGGVGSEKPTGK